jgi:hypothetical protein
MCLAFPAPRRKPQREKLNSDRCIYAYAIWILLGIEKQNMEDGREGTFLRMSMVVSGLFRWLGHTRGDSDGLVCGGELFG